MNALFSNHVKTVEHVKTVLEVLNVLALRDSMIDFVLDNNKARMLAWLWECQLQSY